MGIFKPRQYKVSDKDLKLIRLSVLKELSGDIKNPEFVEDLLNLDNPHTVGIPETPEELPDNLVDIPVGASSTYKHLWLYIIKVGEYLSNMFIYKNEDFDYRTLEHSLYRFGLAYLIKYKGELIPVSGTVDKSTMSLTVNSTEYPHLTGVIYKEGTYVECKNNYHKIGDLWLLYDIMKYIAMEFNELKINSLLTRERLAIAGGGPEGMKMINNIIKALYNGSPVINFDNVMVIERILKGSVDKQGKLSFENRIDKLITSYKHANTVLAREAYIMYNDSANKKERVNMAETNMENIYVKSMIDSRHKFRLDISKQVKKVFKMDFQIEINKEILGTGIVDNIEDKKEMTPNEV